MGLSNIKEKIRSKTRSKTKNRSKCGADDSNGEIVSPELSFFFILRDDKLIVITTPTCDGQNLLFRFKNDISGGIEVNPSTNEFILPPGIDLSESVFTVTRPIKTRLSYADFVKLTREFVCEDNQDDSNSSGGTYLYFIEKETSVDMCETEKGE